MAKFIFALNYPTLIKIILLVFIGYSYYIYWNIHYAKPNNSTGSNHTPKKTNTHFPTNYHEDDFDTKIKDMDISSTQNTQETFVHYETSYHKEDFDTKSKDMDTSSTQNTQEKIIEEHKDVDMSPLLMHIKNVKNGCLEICDDTITGKPGLFFDYIEKKIDCKQIWSNVHIDAVMIQEKPPEWIPDEILSLFTYDNKVQIVPWGTVFNERYLGTKALNPRWEKQKIESWKELCSNGQLSGNYGVEETRYLKLGLDQMTKLKGGNVLVVGSESPWVEACVLASGAKHVTTLEYGEIISEHPQISTITPSEIQKSIEKYLGFFDAVVSFSSVEHSGLGRYGDEFNPWGDRQAIARAWCASKNGAELLLAVQSGNDSIFYNAHRQYGNIMYPHLVANWHQKWRAPGGEQVVHLFEK